MRSMRKEARVRENEGGMYRNKIRMLQIQNCVKRSKGG